MSRTSSNLRVVNKEFLSLERRGTYRGSKDLDWKKLPLVVDLNHCVNAEEASRFSIMGLLSYEDKVMEKHGISNALYETLLERGRKAKLLPLGSNDLRRPIRDGEDGGYSWLAANAAADMLGSPHDPFDLNEVRRICKKGREGARDKLRKLQSAPSEVLDAAVILHSPHWNAHPDLQHFMSQIDSQNVNLLLKVASLINAHAIDHLGSWTWLEDLFDGIAARGADTSGANYNTEMKDQTVVGKALIMAISVVKSELAETKQVCADLHEIWWLNLSLIRKGIEGFPWGDDVFDSILLAMSRVCERVCEREGTLGIPFAMCPFKVLQLEQELQASPLFKLLIPPILSRAIDDVAHLVDLVTALNRLLQRRHHIFKAVDALGDATVFRAHPMDRRSVAIRDYYLLVEKEQARDNETLDTAKARLAEVWRLVQSKITRLYQCNLVDLYDLEIPLERHVPSRRLMDEWDGDEMWRKAGPAKKASKAKTKAKFKMAKPGASKERSAALPGDTTAPQAASHDASSLQESVHKGVNTSQTFAPALAPSGSRGTSQPPAPVPVAEHHSLPVESPPYAQSGHSYRKANYCHRPSGPPYTRSKTP